MKRLLFIYITAVIFSASYASHAAESNAHVCDDLSSTTYKNAEKRDTALDLNKIGLDCFHNGKYEAAVDAFWRALQILQRIDGAKSPAAASIETNLSAAFSEMGDFKNAELMARQSLAVREEVFGSDDLDTIASLNAMAVVTSDLGNLQEAVLFARRAVDGFRKLKGEKDRDTAVALDNLGNLLKRAGDLAGAESANRQALEIFKSVLGTQSREYVTCLNNLAETLRKAGRYDEAEALLRESLEGHEAAFGPEHPKTALILVHLCEVLLESTKFGDAEECYRRALSVEANVRGFGDEQSARAMIGLGRAMVRRGDARAALPYFKAAKASGETDRGYLEALFAVSPNDASTSFEVVQSVEDSSIAMALNQVSARFAKGSGPLAERVREEQDLARNLVQLRKLVVQRISRADFKANASPPDEISEQLRQTEQALAMMRSELSTEFPEYANLLRGEAVPLAEAQSILADDQALVVVDVGQSASYVWAVTKTQAVWKALAVNAQDLAADIRTLRSSLTFKVNKSFDVSLAHKIFERVLAPVNEVISSKPRLSVVTNGALTSIPLSLLVTAPHGSGSLKEVAWLLKSHSVVVLPSVRSLKGSAGGPSKSKKAMIAFADPVFSKGQAVARGELARSLPDYYQGRALDTKTLGARLPRLADTAQEVEAIAKSLAGAQSDIVTGPDATESAVKQASLDQYRIVYFATHGLVAGEVERFNAARAEPALVLTLPDAPSDEDDGLLQASEVAALKLDADWVVLSACNTASSDGVGAESLSGLARAFLFAGGRSLLVSHWDVGDRPTVTLMSSLFSAAKSKGTLSHGELLREAELKLLQSATSDPEAHPRVWAPFVVVGEP